MVRGHVMLNGPLNVSFSSADSMEVLPPESDGGSLFCLLFLFSFGQTVVVPPVVAFLVFPLK